jgi:hypothetical protein
VRALAPALAAAAGVAAAILAVDARARPAGPSVVASCGRTSLVVLFWPHGHGALPALGFPRSRVAHVELYRFAGARTYRAANFVGSLQATGRPVLRCRGQAPRLHGVGRLRPWQGGDRKAAISCAFIGAPTVQFARIGGLWRARLFEGGSSVVLDVGLSTVGGSTAGFTPSRCRRGPAPG